jgi:hypothetical protein
MISNYLPACLPASFILTYMVHNTGDALDVAVRLLFYLQIVDQDHVDVGFVKG